VSIVSQDKKPSEYAAAYAGLISQIGCTTSLASIIIIAIAFAAGRFLDNTLGTTGIFTVLFLVGSFPVTLYVILRLALSTAARAQRIAGSHETKESPEDEDETDT
jgi:F0F1-type ATP synthase assembly protein I